MSFVRARENISNVVHHAVHAVVALITTEVKLGGGGFGNAVSRRGDTTKVEVDGRITPWNVRL